MADQQPGDTTPAAGVPDPTRYAGPGEPPTADVPGWWSGAAAVPDIAPRRSLWTRMADRINGAGPADPDDDRTAIPAVDPWADQDTPAWPDAYTTPPAPMPPTRIESPPPTRIESPPPTRAGEPAPARAGTAPPAAPAAPSPIPAPGTYPPPAGGTGLPPLIPPKLRAWGRRAAAKGQQAAAGTPDRLRSLGRQATTKGQQVAASAPGRLRLLSRRAAPAAAPRIPVQPRTPAAVPWTPPRPRRRRRFRKLGLFLVVVVALTGAYWYVPGLRQYPVTAVLPDSFSDLDLRDNESSRRAADKLADQLQGADGSTFAGIYTDARGKRITVFGVTGLRLTPGTDVEAQLSRLADALNLKKVESFDLGEFGAHQRCGTGRLDDTSVVACTWADHGSLATVLLTRRSLKESAALVAQLRESVLVPAV
jgi:hypothetical protein